MLRAGSGAMDGSGKQGIKTLQTKPRDLVLKFVRVGIFLQLLVSCTKVHA